MNYISRQFNNLNNKLVANVNDGSLMYAEVLDYDPDRYTAKVMLIPAMLETVYLPILSPFTGSNIGMICPLSVGQQVTVLNMNNDPNEMVILPGLYNNKELPPIISGTPDNYGIMNGTMINSKSDFLIADEGTLINFNKQSGITINSKNRINFGCVNCIQNTSKQINQNGNVGINMIPSTSGQPLNNSDKLADLNNQLGAIQAQLDAVMNQLEDFGSRVSLLSLAVNIIGKNPITPFNIFDMFPAIQDSNFAKLYKKTMTRMKSIMIYTSEMISILQDAGVPISSDYTSYVTDMQRTVDEYSVYADLDPKSIIEGRTRQYATSYISDIPGEETVKNAARNSVGYLQKYISIARRFISLIQKIKNRKCNHAYFENEEDISDIVGIINNNFTNTETNTINNNSSKVINNPIEISYNSDDTEIGTDTMGTIG